MVNALDSCHLRHRARLSKEAPLDQQVVLLLGLLALKLVPLFGFIPSILELLEGVVSSQ